MSNFARWAAMSPRQKMMAAISGRAAPTMGLEVRDGRTGAQLALAPLQGIRGFGLVTARMDAGISSPIVSPYDASKMVVTTNSAPVTNVATRLTPSFTRVTPDTTSQVTSSEAPPAATVEDTGGSEFAAGREGGAPEDYYAKDPSKTPTYSNDEDGDGGGTRTVEENRSEKAIAQAASSASGAASFSEFVSSLTPTQKLLIGGAAVLGALWYLSK